MPWPPGGPLPVVGALWRWLVTWLLLLPGKASPNGGEPVHLAVEVDRTVPGSGNLSVGGQQFWLGPDRAGQPVTLWADTTVVHLLVTACGSRPSRPGSPPPS